MGRITEDMAQQIAIGRKKARCDRLCASGMAEIEPTPPSRKEQGHARFIACVSVIQAMVQQRDGPGTPDDHAGRRFARTPCVGLALAPLTGTLLRISAARLVSQPAAGRQFWQPKA